MDDGRGRAWTEPFADVLAEDVVKICAQYFSSAKEISWILVPHLRMSSISLILAEHSTLPTNIVINYQNILLDI